MLDNLLNMAVNMGIPALVGASGGAFGWNALLKRWSWLRALLNKKADALAAVKEAAKAAK